MNKIITVKIKPKLKKISHSLSKLDITYFAPKDGAYLYSYWGNTNTDSHTLKDIVNDNKIIGHFKSIKNARACAELLYRG